MAGVAVADVALGVRPEGESVAAEGAVWPVGVVVPDAEDVAAAALSGVAPELDAVESGCRDAAARAAPAETESLAVLPVDAVPEVGAELSARDAAGSVFCAPADSARAEEELAGAESLAVPAVDVAGLSRGGPESSTSAAVESEAAEEPGAAVVRFGDASGAVESGTADESGAVEVRFGDVFGAVECGFAEAPGGVERWLAEAPGGVERWLADVPGAVECGFADVPGAVECGFADVPGAVECGFADVPGAVAPGFAELSAVEAGGDDEFGAGPVLPAVPVAFEPGAGMGRVGAAACGSAGRAPPPATVVRSVGASGRAVAPAGFAGSALSRAGFLSSFGSDTHYPSLRRNMELDGQLNGHSGTKSGCRPRTAGANAEVRGSANPAPVQQ
ncbi:hypothetical protein [Nocardia brasiliensis]|uniref:hypothetical protein n=1 Tax=Nocardia brasiliensis TaxID=37326 RepID=UPI00366E23D8